MHEILVKCTSQQPGWATALSALLTPVVALLGVVIAFGQLSTAKKKLKFDLFEKRLGIYYSINEFMSFLNSDSELLLEKLHEVEQSVHNSRWLFDEEIYKKLWIIYSKGLRMLGIKREHDTFKSEYEFNKNEENRQRLEKVHKQLNDLRDELFDLRMSLDKDFLPFLSLEFSQKV